MGLMVRLLQDSDILKTFLKMKFSKILFSNFVLLACGTETNPYHSKPKYSLYKSYYQNSLRGQTRNEPWEEVLSVLKAMLTDESPVILDIRSDEEKKYFNFTEENVNKILGLDNNNFLSRYRNM